MQGSLPAPAPERTGGGAAGAAGRGAPRLFIAGGHDRTDWLDSVDVFQPGADGGSWSTLAPQGYPRSFSAAVMLGSGLYVVGGGNGEDWFDSVLRCACPHLLVCGEPALSQRLTAAYDDPHMGSACKTASAAINYLDRQ